MGVPLRNRSRTFESFVGSKKELAVPTKLDAAQALQLPPALYKSRDGRVLTSRSEHHRERVAKCLDASWI